MGLTELRFGQARRSEANEATGAKHSAHQYSLFYIANALIFPQSLYFAHMRVTISVLPVSLSLLHIPRSRLPHLSSHIIRQILQPNPVFLSITSNEIELSIFAESQSLQEFEPIAKRDRHKYHSRSGSASSRQSVPHDFEPVEISCETWCVLQIDSHSDQLGRLFPHYVKKYRKS